MEGWAAQLAQETRATPPIFRVCTSQWIGENPASDIKAPKVQLRPTLPFTREEVIKTLAALEAYGKSAGVKNAQRIRIRSGAKVQRPKDQRRRAIEYG
jgi:hypothetical protein